MNEDITRGNITPAEGTAVTFAEFAKSNMPLSPNSTQELVLTVDISTSYRMNANKQMRELFTSLRRESYAFLLFFTVSITGGRQQLAENELELEERSYHRSSKAIQPRSFQSLGRPDGTYQLLKEAKPARGACDASTALVRIV